MPELLLELLTEEIPARMQGRAADDLCRMVGAALHAIAAGHPRGFAGPRRIGLVAEVAAQAEVAAREERGPRISAPAAALQGFLKKHGCTADELVQEGDFWVLARPGSSVEASALVAQALPAMLWSFPWPKSMRWGVSAFPWIRPLKRILCQLDGVVVPFSLARGEDAAHGLVSSDVTEGHRVHAPAAVQVHGYVDYVQRLRSQNVIVEAPERASIIREEVANLAASAGLEVVPDEALVNEVAGLVEWPVPLLGRIDDSFMDLPSEVMRTSMRVNQRYFALRHPGGGAAARFAVVANIAASDGGATLVAGNERVLRARLADARFFWDQDLRFPLEEMVPRLEKVTFHAKLGTQGQRVRRLAHLAQSLASKVGADIEQAGRAALLCKADLASGMVGEFPELQGIMGGYYARAGGEHPAIAQAIASHYKPLGPDDSLPLDPVSVVVALADKLDQLLGFFIVGERPTGSGDPFALRRAGLGVIRLIRENDLRLSLAEVLQEHVTIVLESVIPGVTEALEASTRQAAPAVAQHGQAPAGMSPVVRDLVAFILERLRVQLRGEGGRSDIVAAAMGRDDDIGRVIARSEALRGLLDSETGQALLAAHKRVQNILRIEDKKDGPHQGPVDPDGLVAEESALLDVLNRIEPMVNSSLLAEDFDGATAALATLRAPVDAFFDQVRVNDADPATRGNRLRLLSRLKSAMETMADLSKIDA
ncbi:MAG: glycine--tRNA ligase subunit beta [Rubritepida sp.]|nr:glycine--tRNA ligase subunit beta [Rubritepida sp.]